MVCAAKPNLIRGILPVIGSQQMSKVSVIDIAAMQRLGGWPFERIRRGFINENRKEVSFLKREWHD